VAYLFLVRRKRLHDLKESLREVVKQQKTTSEPPADPAALAQELRLLLQELRLARPEQVEKPKKESSPLLLPILGGIGTLILAIVNNFASWYSTNSIEEKKFNRELIQKVFTEDQTPVVRRTNFLFLLDIGVLHDKDGRFRKTLEALPLDKTPSFVNDALPTVDKLSQLISKQVGAGILYDNEFTVFVTSDGPGGSVAEDPTWQSATALRYADGKSVDSRQIPYVALPKKNILGDKVQLGDYAVVFDITTGRHAFAVVGDIAPSRNRMGLSVALADLLGLQFDLKADRVATDKIICLAFPASGTGHCPESVAVINAQGANLFNTWGGMLNIQPHLESKK
jgi:hypothetical protein